MFGLMRARTCAKHTTAWRDWQSHYCGTCKTIGARYGQAARMALNHDTVFLAELLTALSTSLPQTPAYRSFNCMSLPKSDEEMPVILRFAAAATIVLTEFKVLDHIEDTGRRRWRTLARVFSKAFQNARRDLANLNFPLPELEKALATQSQREREGKSLDHFSAPTAVATALFFEHGATLVKSPTLASLGHKFGELAYLLDAFEDFEKDRKNAAFNALSAAGLTTRQAIPLLQRLTGEIKAELAALPLPPDVAAAFASRLQANLDARLGLHLCPPRRPAASLTRRERWHEALQFARNISAHSPPWRAGLTVAAVAFIAYLAPAHSRAANTPAECLSLGLNLMALGSMFAMAGVVPPAVPTPKGSGKPARSGGFWGDCCCACDGCDACSCCACESLECCSGDCCCGGCGDCCGSCDCGGCDC